MKFKVSWDKTVAEILKAIDKENWIEGLDVPATRKRLDAFYYERSSHYYENQGYDRDLIGAVLASESDDVLGVSSRLDSLASIRNKRYFEMAQKVIQRTSNMLKGASPSTGQSVSLELLTEKAERELYDLYIGKRGDIEAQIEAGNYSEATRLYADVFFDILHAFFDKVLVNVEDSNTRSNRLTLLAGVRNLYTSHIADLSQLRAISNQSNGH
jgi:glycyl-tRNA synthetase beta chain